MSARYGDFARLAFALAATVALASCQPKPGGACDESGRAVCVGHGAALACVGGRWSAMSCAGRDGCAPGKRTPARCDQAAVSIREPCLVESDLACRDDGKALLRCRSGAWHVASPCRGARGCGVEGMRVDCDVGAAERGEPCTREGDHACSVDGARALTCKSGVFHEATTCRGPRGCTAVAGAVRCDDSRAAPGDACAVAGQLGCHASAEAIVRCDGAKFVDDERCASGKRCVVGERGVACR